MHSAIESSPNASLLVNTSVVFAMTHPSLDKDVQRNCEKSCTLRLFVFSKSYYPNQASRRLHLSHPAASAQIKALERIALFERKPNGLTLTRAGAALLPEIAK